MYATHACMPVSTYTHAAPGTYAPVHRSVHTHIYTCMCLLCIHAQEVEGISCVSTTKRLMELSMATNPLGLIYREITVTLWEQFPGAKRVEKVAGKERVQGL